MFTVQGTMFKIKWLAPGVLLNQVSYAFKIKKPALVFAACTDLCIGCKRCSGFAHQFLSVQCRMYIFTHRM
jgi:hypothetical protein